MSSNLPCRFLLLWILPLWLAACGKPPEQGPGGPPPPAQVSVAAVIEKEVTEWDEFTGRLEAVERVEIRPRISGYVEKVAFQQGAEVQAGDLLFEIDARPLQAELARTEAEQTSAEARLSLAKGELGRADKLLKSKYISQQDYDQLTSTRQDASASLKAAQAAVLTARLNLDYTKVRSPITGRTSRAEVTEGNLVTGGEAGQATLLTTVVSLDPIYAYFEGDEQVYLKYADLSRRGERASSRDTRNPIYLGLSNEEGFPHQGYVDFVDNELNPQTGTIRARAVFDNQQRLFTPGLFARLKLIGSGSYRATLINDKAIGTDQSKKFVLIVGSDNKATYREVKPGPLIDGLRVIKEGLKGGEMIVVNGLQRVHPGDTVMPKSVDMLHPEQVDAAQNAAAPGAAGSDASNASGTTEPTPAEPVPAGTSTPPASTTP